MGSGVIDAVGRVNGTMEVGAQDGTCMAWDPQIIKDVRALRPGTGGRFSELAVVVVVVIVMCVPGGSGRGVCGVSGMVPWCG